MHNELIDLLASMETAETHAVLDKYTGRNKIGYFVSDEDMLKIKKNLRTLAHKLNTRGM